MPEISVIVPFYNAERSLQDCLRGLLTQSYPEAAYEIIMVDNNSTDASLEVVQQCPRVTLLTEKKQGAYAARNRGLAAAQGAIVAFTDPDCVPDTDWLRTITAALRPAAVQVVLGRCHMARDGLGLSLLAAHEHQKISFIFERCTKELYYGYTNNMAVRREVFETVGQFVERSRGADQVFVHQVADAYSCDAIRYDARMCVRHLEMRSIWAYYQKQFVYGRSNRLCNELITSRPLTAQERLQIFRRTVRSGHYSVVHLSLLWSLLTLGVAGYQLGRWAAVWDLWRHAA